MIPIVFRINFKDGSYRIHSQAFNEAHMMLGFTPDYFARRVVTDGFGEKEKTDLGMKVTWHSPLNIDTVEWTEIKND